MTAHTSVDFEAARAAAVELARQMAHRRAGNAHMPLVIELALQVLDHVGGDPLLALYVVADLVDPDRLPPAGMNLTHPPAPSPPGRRLRVVDHHLSEPAEGTAL